LYGIFAVHRLAPVAGLVNRAPFCGEGTFVKDLRKNQKKKIVSPDVASTIAAVYGCKWSLKIFTAIQQGICRPGAMEKALPGLTTRVQSYYFKRMIELGVLNKTTFPEVPPRVEYAITSYGLKVIKILYDIQELQRQMESEQNDPKAQKALPEIKKKKNYALRADALNHHASGTFGK
jgi:DNA-binding HxlR family transcriptional regulator